MPDPQQAPPWKKLLAANTTNAAAFATPSALSYVSATGVWTGVPAGGAVIDTSLCGKNLWMRFFGVGADGNAGEVRVSPIRFAGAAATSKWVPTPMSSFTFTLSTAPGDAATNAMAGDLYADTLVRLGNIGVDNVTDRVVSPAGLNIPASLLVDVTGSRFLLVELRIGACTSVNAEWTPVN